MKTIKKLDASANAAAVATAAADSSRAWRCYRIEWSYDALPTGGNVKIEIGGTEYLSLDITSEGPGQLDFGHPVQADSQIFDEALVVTLAAGGSGVTGKVSALVG